MAAKKTETGQTAVQENFMKAIPVEESVIGTAVERIAEPDDITEVNQEAMKEKSWMVKINNNPDYCGVGAGGIQFANGQALIKSERMAAWFKEHKGYVVVEQ